MEKHDCRQLILEGNTALGIELGSTRIKAVLTGERGAVLALGAYDWENRLENGIWTYSMEEVWAGLRGCYAALSADVKAKYGLTLETIGAIGISGMMHGYLPFDKNGNQLAEFRTWRNTTTGEASERLTELFSFNIPQRWSIAHIYQAMLNHEPHVPDLDFVTSLAGYIHYRLTGERIVGIGEASGIFPVDSELLNYHRGMTEKFDDLVENVAYPWRLGQILPRVLRAGEFAGALTPEGAELLDPTGALKPGIAFAPPEGDAGTGMTATNSVAPRRANVSAGTSVFLMAVLEKPLSKVYSAIDMVTTPSGAPVAMIHANTCTSDLNAWVALMGEAAVLMGGSGDTGELFTRLFKHALSGDADCGGLLNYNYFAGEPVAGVDRGKPLFVREPDSRFNLANFMRAQLYSSVATIKLGMRILEDEQLAFDSVLGHGGFFTTERVGQLIMSAALNAPVTVMETAGEGGPWGMALLASFMKNRGEGESLEAYLAEKIFADAPCSTVTAAEDDRRGFEVFMERYKNGLALMGMAAEKL